MRLVALGDSYAKGEAALPAESWPARAAERLRAEGLHVELVANLGVTGFTSRDVIEEALPELDGLRPDLVALQVGINDLVQGRGEEAFRADLDALVRSLVERVGAGRVVLVDVPDFSVAPAAPRFGDPRALHDGIARRNDVIAGVARAHGARLANVFARSREAARDRALLARDGIHPSAAGYAAWVEDVLPALREASR